MKKNIVYLVTGYLALNAATLFGSLNTNVQLGLQLGDEEIDLSEEGTLGWLTWTSSTSPDQNQVQKADPQVTISYSEKGDPIPRNDQSGWKTGDAASQSIGRTWSDGKDPVAGNVDKRGPHLNKYSALDRDQALIFDFDISKLESGRQFEINIYFTEVAYQAQFSAEFLKDDGSALNDHVSNDFSYNSRGEQEPRYSFAHIFGIVEPDAATVRVTIIPESLGGPSHHMVLSAITVASAGE